MTTEELRETISRDEDSKHQFKGNITNEESLAQEMVAFSNSGGGELYIGVPDGMVLRIAIENGISKPYMDKNGVIWIKSGADKRRATSREEIQRMFQSAGIVHADEVPVNSMDISALDVDYFGNFFEKNFGESIDVQEEDLPGILKNMNLMHEDRLNLTAALLFAKNPVFKLPLFIVKAIAFPCDDVNTIDYLDSRDIGGKLENVFRETLSFIGANIRHVQANQGINSLGVWEIPKIALEELVANALIHRDYFVSAPVRIFVFKGRVEIISPGHLPNNLTVENIKHGNSNIRNPILASYATKIIPYRGLGSGIIRAIKEYPRIEFDDDREGNLFKVTIRRTV
jgi:ATP-dependent DNA helicase RecG